jgi:hypothetical protein
MEPHSSFHFTSTRSFQLFAQGLESLQAYERSANAATLTAAERKFEECVGQFPQDVLPRFYYGVVKTLAGYEGLDEAIRQFNFVLESNAEDLLPDTLYNLAVAHLEKYKPKDRQMAFQLLEKAIEVIQAKPHVEKKTREELEKERREPKLESLRLQAQILQHYLFVEENLWEHRQDEKRPKQELFEEANQRLRHFLEDYNSVQILEAARADLLADYHNVQGTYLESCAYFEHGGERKALASDAAKAFQEALQAKENWIPAKSNLARVYQDLLDDLETAQRLWQEVLETRPHDNYAFYMLGNLHQHRGDKLRAIGAYKKAPYIPEADLNLSLLYLDLGEITRARMYARKVVEADDVRPKTKRDAEEALRKIETLEGSTPASS